MSDALTVMTRADALDACTDVKGTVTRRYGTPALAAAIAAVEDFMRSAGLATRRDALGNLFGRLAGADDTSAALLLGSHLDSVPDGGSYDGPLGVLAAIAVAERIAATGGLPFPLEVCAFADEEGSRFATGYLSSSALAGSFDDAWLDRTDDAGVPLRNAIDAFGGDASAIPTCRRDPTTVRGWIELHIEQGPTLEAEGLPIGVVTGIQGMTQAQITYTGRAAHAGTTAMTHRRDALAAAAETILAVESTAHDVPGLVATVGQIEVQPGATNVIAGRAALRVDVRHPDDGERARALARIAAAARTASDRRGVRVAIETLVANDAIPCDDSLRAAIAAAIAAHGIAVRELPSGAGHDAVPLSRLCPVAMVFLRCRGGISHHPDESIEEADVAVALDVLETTVQRLAGQATA